MFNQNSVPQIPGRGDSLTVFSGAGEQFPGVTHPVRMGLPTVPGAPSTQLASIGNVPSQMFHTGVTGLPPEQVPASGFPAVGNFTLHLPSEVPSSPGFSGMASTGLSEIGDITAAPQTTGFPSGSFSADILTPGLAQQDLSSNIGTAQGFPRMPTNLTGIGLPSLLTESSQSGIAGFGLSPCQIPIGTQDSSFGGSGGSMHQTPGLGTRIPPAVPQVNSGMLPPVSSQVAGIPTDITSPAAMVPTSTTVDFPGTAGFGVEGCGTMIPGSLANFSIVPQDGLSPRSTAMPNGTQRLGDTMNPNNPYARSVDEMGATKPQEMGLPLDTPNPDLLVSIDLCKSRL